MDRFGRCNCPFDMHKLEANHAPDCPMSRGMTPALKVATERFGHSRPEFDEPPMTNNSQDPGEDMDKLSFRQLRAVNVERCEAAFFPLESKDGPWWGNAMAGESGEACNIIKKIDRDGVTPELLQALALELADVVTYADLLAARFGIDLGLAVRTKFNIVSDRRHCNIKL